jgi:uncharacterized lipoprotein
MWNPPCVRRALYKFMDHKMKKTIFILITLLSMSACSTFDRMFPETRNEYQRAQSMPNLEIPPDLTANAITRVSSIPGEDRSSDQNAATPAVESRPAQLQMINNKSIVSIPEEYTLAWTRIEQTLQGAGMVIDARDEQKGTFNVTWMDEAAESRSWFNFWSDDEENYVISLTGVGDKTELVILDEDGEWKPTERSDQLLSTIMSQYNMSNSQPR